MAGIWVQQRVIGMATGGMPLRFVAPKEGVWGHRFMAAAVKGRPAESLDAAKVFLALLLTARQQTAALSLNPLPTNTDVVVSDAIPLKDINVPDQRIIQQNRAALGGTVDERGRAPMIWR